MTLTISKDLKQLLLQLDIEPCFHELIASRCSGRLEYLQDIEAGDLQGQLDANGDAVQAAVARGLVRKLRLSSATTVASSQTSSPPAGAAAVASTTSSGGNNTRDDKDRSSFGQKANSSNDNKQVHPCTVSLCQGGGDYSAIVRCAVRGQFPSNDEVGGAKRGCRRRKILAAILDNSYSMREQWPLVVDALARVFTDQTLRDPYVSLIAIVYNTDATEVTLPRTVLDLSNLLRTKFSPTGLTNFKKAFELAQKCIQREVDKLYDKEVAVRAVDVTTLLFTDGQDTSAAPMGYTSQAATDKARAAGDAFQSFLTGLNCRAHYTCIAAFGEHHNPAQCQYLSDRYYYINRQEVLSEWLSGGLVDLLESSGFCSIRVTSLPKGLSLAEPIPRSTALEAEGRITYEIWLQKELGISPLATTSDEVVVTVDDGSGTVLHGSVAVSEAVVVDLDTLEGRLFRLDWGEMQLRQIARDLSGGHPTKTELCMLRERLAGVKVLCQPVLDEATNPKARIRGRALLLERLEELDTRRNRLSYALGHFEEEKDGDTRHIGSVGIDAVLRDASQRIPLSASAREYASHAERTATLPAAQALSKYGQLCTYDEISDRNAKQAADLGEAMFFRLSDVSFYDDGSIQYANDCGDNPIVYDVFRLISNDGEKAVSTMDGNRQRFTHVGMPFFVSPGHFSRAKLVLRSALERLSSSKDTFVKGATELRLLDLLGQSVSSLVRDESATTMRPAKTKSIGLLHRARSVAAVLASTTSAIKGEHSGKSLLDHVLDEANAFLDHPEKRPNAKNLHRIIASGLLAQDWPAQRLVNLGEAVIHEAIRRAFSRKLKGLSDTERMKLAWALVGPPNDGDDWLDSPIDDNRSGKEIAFESFRFQSAPAELRSLEAASPGKYSPRHPAFVSQALSDSTAAQCGTPSVYEWSTLRSLLSKWGALMEQEQSSGGIWMLLDDLMTKESSSNDATLHRLWQVLVPEPQATTLREVLPDPMRVLSCLVRHCIRGLSESGSINDSGDSETRNMLQEPRLVLASQISSIVNQRVAHARNYPIQGAAYPTTRPCSEMNIQSWWGSEAKPVDEQLHREVRRSIYRRYPGATIVIKEALTDKAYRKQGGRFEFPSEFDTFIPGLHRRTRDLHDAWKNKKRMTHGPDAREEAVKEMLLRLRWDDRDDFARAKLSKIVAQIWDGMEGIKSSKPISSALWLDDDDEDVSDSSIPKIVTTINVLPRAGTGGESVTTGEDWSVL